MPDLEKRRVATAGLGLALALMTLIAVVAHRSIVDFDARARWVDHSHQALSAAQEVLSLIHDARASQRGYLLTGDAQYLEPYEAASGRLDDELARLRRLTEDNPRHQRRIEALRPLVTERLALLRVLIEEKRSAPPGTSPDLALLASAKAFMDRIRALLGEIEAEERNLLAQRERESRESADFAVAVVVFGSTASAVMLLGAFGLLRREIGQRLAAEAALRRHAEEIEDLYNHAPCGYHSLDAEGVVVRINDTELSWLGYARDDVVGKLRIFELLTPASAESIARPFAALKESGTIAALDVDLLRKDRSVLSAFLSATAICDAQGNFVMTRSTLFDVTKRKRIERDLDRIFTLSQDLVCIAGFDGRFNRVNPSWERVLGFTPQELTTTPFLEFVHPDDRASTLAAFETQLHEGLTITTFENRYRCKDGSYRVLLWNSTPVPDDGLIYAIAHDITERKRDEEALRAAKLTAEAAGKELEAFSYSVSHDLRAPLRAIDGFSQALLEDHVEVLDGEGKRHLERVRSAAQRMSDLIEDLLKLSRLSRLQLQPEGVDLSALAMEAVEGLRRADPGREVAVQIAGGLRARGDARLLRIVLENLLGNAWKYTRKREGAEIEFSRAFVGGEAAWFVRDNGAGFDMVYADKLFGAFQRLHRVEEFEGTGIGLATAQRIIRLHGGRIWAEGAVDEGATFFFSLGTEGGSTR